MAFVTIDEIAEGTGLSKREIRKTLKKLEKEGLVEKKRRPKKRGG